MLKFVILTDICCDVLDASVNRALCSQVGATENGAPPRHQPRGKPGSHAGDPSGGTLSGRWRRQVSASSGKCSPNRVPVRVPTRGGTVLAKLVGRGAMDSTFLECLHLDFPAQGCKAWSGVVHLRSAVGPSSWLVEVKGSRTTMLLCLQADELEVSDKVTIIHFELCEHSTLHVIKHCIGASWWKHQPWNPLHCTRVREACTGLGGLGFGLNRVGVQTIARNEVQPKTLQVLGKQGAVPIVPGDISNVATAKALYEADCVRVCSGFSCQPFSQLGDGKRARDTRSQSLTGVLRAAYFNGAAFVLLECVAPASDDPFVRASIKEFLQATDFKAVELTLDLQEVWCAKRKHWWCLLISKQVPLDSIPNWPGMTDCRKVSEVIQVSGATAEEVSALTLSEEELFEFQARKPVKGYLLNAERAMPTALHSWGSQIAACPCACRRFPFTKSRLDKGGVCAVIVPLAQGEAERPCFRHFGKGSCSLKWSFPNDPRLAPALVGQLASPFLAAWVMSHLAGALHEVGTTGLCTDPSLELLRNQRTE